MTAPDPTGPAGRPPPIVGLRREREVLTVALDTGRHVVLAAGEGGWGGGREFAPAIVAFSGGVTVLQAQGARRDPAGLVGDLVTLRGHGMTDLAAALRAAAAQLAGAAVGERVAVLLSDCLPTAGGDPALALTGISRLHVLCPLPTAEAERAAADLARRGGGVSQPVHGLTDVAQAVTRVLSS